MNQFTKSVGLQFYHSAPLYMLRACYAQLFGSYRDKERLALLSRPPYAYGLVRAAEWARNCGKQNVTVCEFGVARGDGLLSLIKLVGFIGPEMKVRFQVCGFDAGAGLPSPCGPKDHPEIWKAGNFPMDNREELTRRVQGRARMFWGDIRQTVDDFLSFLTPDAPLGFVSIDVDYYSTAKSALRCLEGAPQLYNPAVPLYFDDVEFFTNCEWAGELSAIREFNDELMAKGLPAGRHIFLETTYGIKCGRTHLMP
jgi:hypothetical protein